VKNPFRKQEASGVGLSILIFSTTANQVTMIAETLRVDEYHVAVSLAVAEAMEVLDTEGLPDLFIFDCLHPESEVNDFLTITRLRFGKSALPPMLVVLDAPNDEQVAQAIQAQDVLPKPFTDIELLQRAKQLIDRQQPKNLERL
jgi:DNA-binding response OmpR family regulator